MTRTDVMASSRPRTADAAPKAGRSKSIRRGLAAVPVVLVMGFALLVPSAALAAEGTSSYNQAPPPPPTTTPKTTPTTPTPTPTPTTGTSPSKEAEKPATKEEPTKAPSPSSGSPAPTAEKATLPFTGFDLRTTIALGLVLMGGGLSILLLQRRMRRGGSR